jgi:hypothetical protein
MHDLTRPLGTVASYTTTLSEHNVGAGVVGAAPRKSGIGVGAGVVGAAPRKSGIGVGAGVCSLMHLPFPLLLRKNPFLQVQDPAMHNEFRSFLLQYESDLHREGAFFAGTVLGGGLKS